MGATPFYRAIAEKLKEHPILWDLFTRAEEYSPFLLDRYARFPYYAARHSNVLEPFISEFFVENGLRVSYPGNKKFAVFLSHDIDNIALGNLKIVYEIWRSVGRRNIREAIMKAKALFGSMVKKWNPVPGFEEIMDIEQRYGATSTFYIMAKDREFEEFLYDAADLKKEIRTIAERGWEVGLHGSSKAHNNRHELTREKEKLESVLGKSVTGYRNHGLHFKTPDTWKHLQDEGFLYDATLGYFDMVGFRNGMCHPFYPYNAQTKEYMNIMEIPLVVMDGTLFDYMRLDMEKAWAVTKHLIDTVEKNNGVMSILWHNTAFDDIFCPGWKSFYEKILLYCFEKNAWITKGNAVVKHYKEHACI